MNLAAPAPDSYGSARCRPDLEADRRARAKAALGLMQTYDHVGLRGPKRDAVAEQLLMGRFGDYSIDQRQRLQLHACALAAQGRWEYGMEAFHTDDLDDVLRLYDAYVGALHRKEVADGEAALLREEVQRLRAENHRSALRCMETTDQMKRESADALNARQADIDRLEREVARVRKAADYWEQERNRAVAEIGALTRAKHALETQVEQGEVKRRNLVAECDRMYASLREATQRGPAPELADVTRQLIASQDAQIHLLGELARAQRRVAELEARLPDKVPAGTGGTGAVRL